MKTSRITAEKLLTVDPTYYDAHLAVGVENYMLSLKAAPVRWLLQMAGAQTDREQGVERLRITAEKGTYLKPFARLLLAVAALRAQDPEQARKLLHDLALQFPHNPLYAEELARLR
jgi:Tfp pilus assembly protein PilF